VPKFPRRGGRFYR